MSLWYRLVVVTVLSATAFAGCGSQSGLSAESPDSGVPGSVTPDSGSPGTVTPDSRVPGSVTPDSARPDATPTDSATPDGRLPSPDTTVPLPATDTKTDAEFVRGEAGPPLVLDAGDAGSSQPPVGLPLFTVNPPSVDVGSVEMGAASPPVTITVTNVGTTTSGPLSVTVTGAGITVSGCSGVVLAPKDTCQLSISARPAASGPISGVVEVGDRPANSKKIAVSGIVTAAGQWSLSPNSLDLGAVLTAKSATGTVVLTNASPTGLTGIVVIVSGIGFTRYPSGGCTDSLPVGQSCNIDVTFAGGAASGPAKGAVTVSQGGVTKIAALNAIVQTPAKLVITPATAGVLTVVGTPSAPVTFYVANAGDVSSAIPTVTITGNDSSDFSYESTCTKSLPGGAAGSCQITVVYNPKTVPLVNSSAKLTVSELSFGSSASATLTGTAVPRSSLVLTSTSPDLGTVVVGEQSTPSSFTLTNSGGDDSGAVKLVSSSPQFAIATDNCTGKNMASGQECTFTVRFTPATGDAGVVQAQIRATALNTENPAIFSITAAAVPAAKLAINPAALDFGTVLVSQQSAPLTLTVANTGGAPTGALKVDKSGAQFTIKGDTCSGASLTAAGTTSTCVLIVTFTPTASTEATGGVSVSTPANASTITATLRGIGL